MPGTIVAPRRRLPAAQRRAVILDAALRTFSANGYDGAAMDEIAAAAGISKAVVYDHVDSKRDLYTQLLNQIRLDIEDAVDRALEPLETDEERRFHAAADAVYRYVEEHQEASRLLLLELHGANLSPVGRELEQRITDGLAQTLANDPGLFDGHPSRARQVTIFAEMLKWAVLGLARWWYGNPDVPRQDLVDHTVAMLWPAVERARSDLA
jgi:AcrR family transcriptional regulator